MASSTPPKAHNGGRAIIKVAKDPTKDGTIIGIWGHFSYSQGITVDEVWILGRFTVAELVTTSYSPVSIDAGGFRAVNHGVFEEVGVTNLKDLLTQLPIVLTVHDRQPNNGAKTNLPMATILGCLPTGHSTRISIRALTDQTNTYKGMLMYDESGAQAEVGAVNFPEGV